MIHTLLSRYIGFVAIGCGLIAAIIYTLMISVTLAHIEAVSGLVPFDMRPLGYSPTEAARLLEALGADGRAYYLSHQIPLDTIYPAMLALTLIATFGWFGRRMPGSKLVRSGTILSVGCALFDYLENIGIAAMIWSWPDVPIALVYAASSATIFKSALTTLAVLLTLLIGVLWVRLPKSGTSYLGGQWRQSPANQTFAEVSDQSRVDANAANDWFGPKPVIGQKSAFVWSASLLSLTTDPAGVSKALQVARDWRNF